MGMTKLNYKTYQPKRRRPALLQGSSISKTGSSSSFLNVVHYYWTDYPTIRMLLISLRNLLKNQLTN